MVKHSKLMLSYYISAEMTFKEIYCYDCRESLGEYNEKYYSKGALYDIILLNRDSQVHKHHDISIHTFRKGRKGISKHRGMNKISQSILSIPVQIKKYISTVLHAIV